MRQSSRVFNLIRRIACGLSLTLLLVFVVTTEGEEISSNSLSDRIERASSLVERGNLTEDEWKSIFEDRDFGINILAVRSVNASAAKLPVVGDALIKFAFESRFAPLRYYACDALSRFLHERLIAECTMILSGDNHKAAVLALDALGHADQSLAIKLLADILTKSKRSALVQQVFKVLLRNPTKAGLEMLSTVAHDRKAPPALRTQAIGSMRVFRFSETIAAMIDLLTDIDIEVVDAAWVGLMAVTGIKLDPEPALWEEWWVQNRATFRWPQDVVFPQLVSPEVERDEREEVLERGFKWLIAHQDDDGRFDSLNYSKHDPNRESGTARNWTDVCMTSLAVLAMLSQGIDETQKGGRERAESVAKAMKWLVAQPKESGNYRSVNMTTYVHEQGVATWALAEYVAAGHKEYERYMFEAFDRCMAFRDGDMAWGYPGMLNNTTNSCVTYWYACAFAAARNAGYELPREGWDGIADWFDRATEEYSGLIYNASAKEPSPAMTAAGLLVKSFMKWNMWDIVQKRSSAVVIRREVDKSSYYDLYLYMLAMSRLDMEIARTYSFIITLRLIALQEREGVLAGSWPPNRDIWETSRLYTAAMALTALTVPNSKLSCLRPVKP